MFSWLLSLDAQRQRLANKAPEGALKDYLSVPFPATDTPLTDVDIISLDFETTGLNVHTDKILSAGYVSVSEQQIKLATAKHNLVSISDDLKADNVCIHQITDQDKNQGLPLQQVVEQLLSDLTGKVMLVHFHRIEKYFLQHACKQLYGISPVFPIIDTLMLAKQRKDKSAVPYDPSALRLMNLRAHFHLPQHFAHNALNDAIATAELYFAEINQLKLGMNTPLKQVLI